MTAGQDGFRNVNAKHSVGLSRPMHAAAFFTSRIDRSPSARFLARSNTASFMQSRRANPSGRGGRDEGRPVSLATHHELPGDACDLVGQCHGHELRWFAPKQIQQPG
jgi:hypothetical protein